MFVEHCFTLLRDARTKSFMSGLHRILCHFQYLARTQLFDWAFTHSCMLSIIKDAWNNCSPLESITAYFRTFLKLFLPLCHTTERSQGHKCFKIFQQLKHSYAGTWFFVKPPYFSPKVLHQKKSCPACIASMLLIISGIHPITCQNFCPVKYVVLHKVRIAYSENGCPSAKDILRVYLTNISQALGSLPACIIKLRVNDC